MAHRSYAKLFYDLDAAKAFGAEVDVIASQAVVPMGQSGKPKTIFIGGIHAVAEHIGNYHYIKKDEGARNQDKYYVRYNIYTSRNGAQRSDLLTAEREAQEQLEEKYQELGPDTGVSRA